MVDQSDFQEALRSLRALDPTSDDLPQLTLELGEGPSLTAIATDDVVVSTDASADPRWPALARMLRHQRVRTTVSLPVRLRGRPYGTLDLIAEDTHQVHASDIDAAGAVADVLAEFLDTAAKADERAGRVLQLERALTARVIIEQAKGVLMERAGVSGPEAFMWSSSSSCPHGPGP